MSFLNRAGRQALDSMAKLPVRFEARSTPAAESAELYIYDAIGDYYEGVSAKQVAAALAEIRGAKSLTIRIHSPGGDVMEAVAISTLLRDFKAPKTVMVDGLAASAATSIAMVGDRIVTAKNAKWMIHNPWGIAVGAAQNMRAQADLLDEIRDDMLATYAQRTGSARGQISQWMTDETWMTAEEAKARGFTDEIDGDCEDDDEACNAKVEPFRPRAFALLNEFSHTPRAVNKRGPDSARLAEAISHRLRIKGRQPERAA